MRQKSKYGAPGPATRAEFEHNLYLVVDDINLKVERKDFEAINRQYWTIIPQLKHTRTLPNARFNLLTVDETLRLHANSMHWFSHMPPPRSRPESKSPEGSSDAEIDSEDSAH